MNRLNLKSLPMGSREAWFFTATVFFGIIGVGVSLITLSAFGAQTVTNSTCSIPSVNVSSSNCPKIDTIIQPSSGGSYSAWGPRGAFLVILGVVGLPSFLALAIVYYLEYGRKSRQEPAKSDEAAEKGDDKVLQSPKNLDRPPSPETSEEGIPDLIKRVDEEFSHRRVLMFWVWFGVVILVFVLIYAGILSYSDLAIRIAILVGGVAVQLAMMQIILDQYDSWIADANYRRLGEAGKASPLLYALIMMKTSSPRFLLGDAYRLNQALFEPSALIERLYQ
jgi:hypothetical protein